MNVPNMGQKMALVTTVRLYIRSDPEPLLHVYCAVM